MSLLYAVKQVELAIRHALDSLLRPTGVGTIPYTALTVLERDDGLTASEPGAERRESSNAPA
jgi:hypothetical protein